MQHLASAVYILTLIIGDFLFLCVFLSGYLDVLHQNERGFVSQLKINLDACFDMLLNLQCACLVGYFYVSETVLWIELEKL